MSVNSVLKISSTDNKIHLQDLDMPDKFRPEKQNLVLKNSDLFASKDSGLGRTDVVEMKIDTGDTKPIKMRSYRTPLKIDLSFIRL